MKTRFLTTVCALLALAMLPTGASAKAKGVENIIVEIEGTNYNNSVHSVCECVDYLRKTPFGELSYGK